LYEKPCFIHPTFGMVYDSVAEHKGKLKESVGLNRHVIFTIKQGKMIFKAIEYARFSKSQEFLNAN
jgi:prophage DNA circulation protein